MLGAKAANVQLAVPPTLAAGDWNVDSEGSSGDLSQLGQSMASPGSCPLRRCPLELGLMSVAKLQVSLVRLVRSMMLESLPACLFMDFCELTKPDLSSPSQIGTPLHQVNFYTTTNHNEWFECENGPHLRQAIK